MKKFFGILGVIILLVLIVIAILFFTGKIGFGSGSGSGESLLDILPINSDSGDAEEEKTIIVVKVEDSDIYVDGEKCDDVEAMKDKISKIQAAGNTLKYSFEHEYAIKETADAVSEALVNLQDTLGISVDFND